MQKIIFATGNKDKMREVREILGTDYEIISMKEAGISVDIDENGTSYAQNALIKCREVRKAALEKGMSDFVVMSDDSGFEVDYLDKAPGIYSARFMGEDTSYDIKNSAILEKLKDVAWEQRTARFMCAIGIVYEDGTSKTAEASFEGYVAYEIKGEYGFGYDPIFYVPEYGCNDAELLPEVKNKISHRYKALMKAKEIL